MGFQMKWRPRGRAVSLSAALGIAGAVLLAGTLPVGWPAAAAGVTISDKCAKLTGNFGVTVVMLSGCTSNVKRSDPAETGQAETKGAGRLSPPSEFGTGTITWTAPFDGGETVALENYTVNLANPDETETKTCPAGTTEWTFSATVAAGSDDATGTVSFEFCKTTSGDVSLEPGTKATTTEPGPPNS
jgi:hypothetical protein